MFDVVEVVADDRDVPDHRCLVGAVVAVIPSNSQSPLCPAGGSADRRQADCPESVPLPPARPLLAPASARASASVADAAGAARIRHLDLLVDFELGLQKHTSMLPKPTSAEGVGARDDT